MKAKPCPSCGRALLRNGEPQYITNSLHLAGRCRDALVEESYQFDLKSRMENIRAVEGL